MSCMSQKYEQFSKQKEYEKADIVEKCNSINMDNVERIVNPQCLSCRQCCPDFQLQVTGKCENYSRRMTLKEINREIKKQKINIKRLCNDYGLSRNLMYEMLKNKRVFKYSYYIALEERIMESEDYIPYIEEVVNG